MSGTGPQRVAQATAVAAIGVPGVLLAHLLTTGLPAAAPAAAGAVLAVLVVGGLRRAGSAPALALLTGLAQLAGHAVLALTSPAAAGPPACIPAVGRGAALGLHLAVLRSDAACPPGTLAAGPTATACLAAVGVALAVVVGNTLVAALGGLLLTVVRRAGQVVRRISSVCAGLAATIGALIAGTRLTVRPALRALPATRTEQDLRPQWRPGTVPLRGPPAPRPATA